MTDSRLRSVRVRALVAGAIVLTLAGAATAQQQGASSAASPAAPAAAKRTWPLTRPEATNYTETSRYDEVVAFMKAMAAASPRIHLTTYGYTFEGRPMPLAVIGAPGVTPEQVLATGKTRIYIQGNIHAGEVEGKEACLWLLRSIAKGERAGWFQHVVLLVNPIYNADGNERVSVRNRGSQFGPIGGMGQRANAENLDLNRDNTKLETSEARSLARLLSQYHPHIAIDLHTTNGSDHGFFLTYETSGSPNTSTGIANLVRGGLLPSVTKAIKAKHGWSYFYYGGPTRSGERMWAGDPISRSRATRRRTSAYGTGFGILSETYSYASFEDRIKASYWFLEGIISYAVTNSQAIRKATAAADAESIVGTPQFVRARMIKAKDPVEVVLADVVDERNPYVPDRPMRRRVDGSERLETMPHLGVVEGTETSIVPRAYVISSAPVATPAPAQAGGQPASVPAAGRQGPPGAPVGAAGPGGRGGMGGPFGRPMGNPTTRVIASVVDRLEAHGVKYFKTARDTSFKGDRFKITSSEVAQADYQGTHRLRSMTGAWEATEQAIPAGSLVIPMDQPLARLAFMLLDPRSDDGFMAWNILDPILGASPAPEFYPVLRTMEAVAK